MRKYSPKGFIAIDLDGTALVQKFDKNKLYGFMNSRSDLRSALIQYCHMAQHAGYDVVILTARPKLIEKILLEPGRKIIGTKPTLDIVAELKSQGIEIADVIRTLPKGLKEGLKGSSMANLLENYRNNGAIAAEGILFDDQLKQVKDVKKIGDPQLIAYDINSYKDRAKFTQKMHAVPLVLTEPTSEITSAIHNVRKKIPSIAEDIYPREKRILNKILNDLTTRLKEADECAYQPEIDWVKNAINGVDLLVKKLLEPAHLLTYDSLLRLSKSMLGHTNPSTFVPNTKCERTIKSLLIYMTRLQLLADIKDKCKTYQVHLNQVIVNAGTNETPMIKKAKEKLLIVNSLIDVLENTKNPTKALGLFNQIFHANEKMLRTSRTGSEFVKAICSFLEKIPVLGHLFKSKGGRLTDSIQHTSRSYTFYKTKHYQKEVHLSPIDNEENVQDNTPKLT